MNDHPNFNKTRIAPTPSGYLHLGNIYSFVITVALARRSNARILLRIDDFDRERTHKRYVQDIFDTLNFLEIPWDEGPKNADEFEREFSQSHREALYAEALQQLRESGRVFACTCSRTDVQRLSADSAYSGTCRTKQIPLDAANTSWRINTTEATELRMSAYPGGHITSRLPANMQDFIVKKKDGLPAYQLTSVIDDAFFDIDLVVRGDDLLPSTLAQLYLSQFTGHNAFSGTTFYHHPLILGPDGNKLSKSEGATSVHYLRQQHKTAADIYSLMAGLLGIDATPKNWQELVPLLGVNEAMPIRF